MAGNQSRADDDLDDEEIELIKKHRASRKGSGRTVRVWEVPEELMHKMFGTGDDDGDDQGDDVGDGGDTPKKKKGWFD